MLFAIQASHTLGRVMTQKQLTDAMTTRSTIARAIGIVMQRYQLGPDRAFEFLTRVSRINDLTLETLAAQMIEDITHQHNSMTITPQLPTRGRQHSAKRHLLLTQLASGRARGSIPEGLNAAIG